ncbi:hypothetical protein [Streptomyces sp. NPDC085466]|uniref:hypothetical protein n=1 Tax=Streptomyces sp. NPDC085466 TaxID=3365725 RepID=UPI0037D0442A
MRDRLVRWLRRPPSKERTVEVLLVLGMALGLALYDGTWLWLRPVAWLTALWTGGELLRRAVWRRGARRAALS